MHVYTIYSTQLQCYKKNLAYTKLTLQMKTNMCLSWTYRDSQERDGSDIYEEILIKE